MAQVYSITQLIESLIKDGRKSYFTYTPEKKVSAIYEATVNAKNGDACLVTHYEYDVDGLIKKSYEEVTEWDDSWDIQ